MMNLLFAAMLMVGLGVAHPAIAQQSVFTDRSIVFTLDTDEKPFVLYVGKTGAVFLALGFAGDEVRCGWTGRFGVGSKVNGSASGTVRANGPGCSAVSTGTATTTVAGNQLQLSSQATFSVTGTRGTGILTSFANAGAFPTALQMAATIQGGTCTVSGSSLIAGTTYRWGVTSCRVEQGNALR